ncbi:MAG: DNA polymerase IV [Erysipelotrichaceae bacterium]
MDRVIVHSDLNHCYAQIEEMLYPHLRDVPMVVGGSQELRHGIVLAKNDLAKPFNIKTGEPIISAQQKCPDLVIVPPNYDKYLYYSEQVKNVYRRYSNKVESFGIDEAWIDLTHSQLLYGDGVSLAKKIQDEIYEEFGLTVSMGVSYNKIYAKLGSDLCKKKGFSVITPNNYQQIVYHLPVEDLLYVGNSTKIKLNNNNIYTIGDLANYPIEKLEKILGKIGVMIHYFAKGEDVSEVDPTNYISEAKSIGNSITAVHDITCASEAKLIFYVLCESICSRLRDINKKAYVISISLRNTDLKTITRQMKVDSPLNTTKKIMPVVMTLLNNNYLWELPLRSIGVSTSSLVNDDCVTQLNLWEDVSSNDLIIEKTIDDIRNKYGFYSIKRLSLLLDEDLTDFNPKGDHVIFPVSFL